MGVVSSLLSVEMRAGASGEATLGWSGDLLTLSHWFIKPMATFSLFLIQPRHNQTGSNGQALINSLKHMTLVTNAWCGLVQNGRVSSVRRSSGDQESTRLSKRGFTRGSINYRRSDRDCTTRGREEQALGSKSMIGNFFRNFENGLQVGKINQYNNGSLRLPR